MRRSVNRLRQVATLATKFDQVPSQVQFCLELVRTCDHDLQHLIQLRNEHAALLEQHSGAIKRIDNIIEAAQKGLDYVCKLVENCRPEAHAGKTPLRNKLKWVLVDSLSFEQQGPFISRHHASILAELTFVRQLALVAASEQQTREKEAEMEKKPAVDKKTTEVFQNLTLLGDLIGDLPGASIESQEPSKTPPVPTNNTMTTSPAPTAPSLILSPLIDMTCTQVSVEYHPSSSPQMNISSATKEKVYELDSNPRAVTILPPPSYCDEKEVVPDRHPHKSTSQRIVLDSTEKAGLSMLFDDYATMTPYSTPQPAVLSPASMSTASLTSKIPSSSSAYQKSQISTSAESPPFPPPPSDSLLESASPGKMKSVTRPKLDPVGSLGFSVAAVDESGKSRVGPSVQSISIQPLSTIPPEMIYTHTSPS